MSCNSRSPTVVVGYLMHSRGWSLAQSYQHVMHHRPSINLNAEDVQRLSELEVQLRGCSSVPPAGLTSLPPLPAGGMSTPDVGCRTAAGGGAAASSSSLALASDHASSSSGMQHTPGGSNPFAAGASPFGGQQWSMSPHDSTAMAGKPKFDMNSSSGAGHGAFGQTGQPFVFGSSSEPAAASAQQQPAAHNDMEM